MPARAWLIANDDIEIPGVQSEHEPQIVKTVVMPVISRMNIMHGHQLMVMMAMPVMPVSVMPTAVMPVVIVMAVSGMMAVLEMAVVSVVTALILMCLFVLVRLPDMITPVTTGLVSQ